ncbi:MAG: tripartite tricarboxylate transporter substrate binding protein [Betaproteobacteria bacterium]|nr:tripartite tricarboxylate transporter substrate binding protein [Betaproteobacteria bacterium]
MSIVLVALPVDVTGAAEWRPTKTIELVVGAGAGGGLDRAARLVQKLLTDRRIVEVPVVVSNKPGGGGGISWAYLNQHEGDAHFVGITSPNITIASIQGTASISFRDISPLSMLYTEYIAMTVRADSPIRSARDLIERLKREPQSVALAFSTTLGNNNHIAIARVVKAAGGNIKRLKVIAFRSASEHVSAVLGGHVDVSITGPANFVQHKKSGQLRLLAITSPQRLEGEFADVPTWRELGINVVESNGRFFLGPKGLTPEQMAGWDDLLSKVARDNEFRRSVEAEFGTVTALSSGQTLQLLTEADREYRSILTELGFAGREGKKNP